MGQFGEKEVGHVGGLFTPRVDEIGKQPIVGVGQTEGPITRVGATAKSPSEVVGRSLAHDRKLFFGQSPKAGRSGRPKWSVTSTRMPAGADYKTCRAIRAAAPRRSPWRPFFGRRVGVATSAERLRSKAVWPNGRRWRRSGNPRDAAPARTGRSESRRSDPRRPSSTSAVTVRCSRMAAPPIR